MIRKYGFREAIYILANQPDWAIDPRTSYVYNDEMNTVTAICNGRIWMSTVKDGIDTSAEKYTAKGRGSRADAMAKARKLLGIDG